MTLRVKHGGEAPGECRERCCVCRVPTNYWYKPLDVALCEDCALTTKKTDLPTKAEWCAREAELDTSFVRYGNSKNVPHRPIAAGLEERRVVCAANRYCAVVVTSARHGDALMHQQMALLSPLIQPKCFSMWEQGFIDQWGVFMTREEAWGVAKKASQIRKRVGGDDKRLYSENLY